MCGIAGVVAHTPVNQMLYDALLLLQHRGQDAAGIVTAEGAMFHMHKARGYVRDVFRTRNMRDVAPGEAIFIDLAGQFHARQCADNPVLMPCIFEYVYLARPDSVIDG